jgi:hypothetical protein
MNQVLEQELVTEVSIESVLLDADLFVKYKSPEKAFNLLRNSIKRSPRSIPLREKLREICITHKNANDAARQCLALVSLYIGREDFDLAYDRLQEAKLLDPRISVAAGLEAIRRARRPDFAVNRDKSPVKIRTDATLAGNLAYVSLFDAVQAIENSRMTYTLSSTQDDGLNNTSNAEINGDFSREFTRNVQDRRHRIAFSGTFDTPVWLGKLRFSPLFRAGSSAPFNLGNGGDDRNLDDLSTDRLNFSGNLSDIVYREPGSPFPQQLVDQFSLAPIGARGGNLPRNSGTGPSFFTFDLNVSREFRFRERMKLRPTIEFDNILNASVFSYGAAFIDFDGIGSNASAATIQNFRDRFLVPTRTYRQRQIRLGIRFDF